MLQNKLYFNKRDINMNFGAMWQLGMTNKYELCSDLKLQAPTRYYNWKYVTVVYTLTETCD